jgi:hypothetical protein
LHSQNEKEGLRIGRIDQKEIDRKLEKDLAESSREVAIPQLISWKSEKAAKLESGEV